MPGITIVAGDHVCGDEVRTCMERLAQAHEEANLLCASSDNVAVGWLAHSAYPKRFIACDGGVAVLEGTLHGESAETIDRELRRLVALLRVNESGARRAATQFAARAEGDFTILLLSQASNRILIVNDVFGRLPLFITRSARRIVISRDVKAAVALGEAGQVEKQTIAEILLLGFPLGVKTVVDNVTVLVPGSAITLALAPLSVDIRSYHAWNFEDLIGSQPARSRAQLVNETVQLFEATCYEQSHIAGFGKRMLELSGGLDSRSVAAGLAAAGTRFVSTTFTLNAGHDSDVMLAERVAAEMHSPWRLYSLMSPTWEEIVESVLLRDGLNFCGMATRVQYMRSLRRDYGGDLLCFTGDGGDKVLPDLRPPWWVKTIDALLEHRLETNVWPIQMVAKLLGMEAWTIKERIREHLATYPERTMQGRETHFLIMERGLGWLLHGEERNRSFLWHQTPFYGRRFFERVMSVDPKLKANYAFYARFLRQLDVRLATLPNAKWNAPIGSWQALWHDAKDALSSEFPTAARSALRRLRRSTRGEPALSNDASAAVVESLERLLRSEIVREVFPGVTPDLLRRCSQLQFDYLATQIIYVAHTWGRVPAQASP